MGRRVLAVIGVVGFTGAFGCATSSQRGERPGEVRRSEERPSEENEVEPGATGLFRVDGVDEGRYALTLLFPGHAEALQRPVKLGGRVVLFDAQGVLATVEVPSQGEARAWCEGQGGGETSFRPEFPLTLDTGTLRRPLEAIEELGGLAGFVRVVRTGPDEIATSSGAVFAPAVTALLGDVNGDGPPEAWVTTSRQSGCEGLAAYLHVAGERFSLSCCAR